MRLILAAMLLTRVASAETVTFETAKIGLAAWLDLSDDPPANHGGKSSPTRAERARHRYSRSCLKTKHLDDSPSQSTTKALAERRTKCPM